jgi:hypothetical protein
VLRFSLLMFSLIYVTTNVMNSALHNVVDCCIVKYRIIVTISSSEHRRSFDFSWLLVWWKDFLQCWGAQFLIGTKRYLQSLLFLPSTHTHAFAIYFAHIYVSLHVYIYDFRSRFYMRSFLSAIALSWGSSFRSIIRWKKYISCTHASQKIRLSYSWSREND